jgi:Flp pilus assembly protein TadG
MVLRKFPRWRWSAAFPQWRRGTGFLREQQGAVAPMFALAIIPVFGLIGMAVDYSRGNAVKTSLQAALDATSLAMARLAPTLTTAQLQTQATAYFMAQFNRPEAKNVVVTPTYTTSGGSQLTITASGTVDTDFMRVMGYSSLHVGSSSTVKWGNARLRVALVLDNTGSMSDDGKMAALKTATNSLLSQLKSAVTTNGDVYVSIIPFVKDVNVGSGNFSASWIDWTAWNAANGSCSSWSYNDQSSCTNAGKTWTVDNHNTWNGCVVDRGRSTGPSSGNYDTNVVAPGTSNSTKFAAEQYGSCPQAVMPLSYNWAAMTTLVNNMSPAGNTNQGIGLAHGWMSLVGGGPYPTPPAMDPNYKYQQVVILLTDGLNTQNRWYTSQSSIDTRQQMTCDNAKAAGITLYMVQVNTGGDPTSNLLKNCASDSSKFFLVTASSGISAVFSTIGTALSQLRISK